MQTEVPSAGTPPTRMSTDVPAKPRKACSPVRLSTSAGAAASAPRNTEPADGKVGGARSWGWSSTGCVGRQRATRPEQTALVRLTSFGREAVPAPGPRMHQHAVLFALVWTAGRPGPAFSARPSPRPSPSTDMRSSVLVMYSAVARPGRMPGMLAPCRFSCSLRSLGSSCGGGGAGKQGSTGRAASLPVLLVWLGGN